MVASPRPQHGATPCVRILPALAREGMACGSGLDRIGTTRPAAQRCGSEPHGGRPLDVRAVLQGRVWLQCMVCCRSSAWARGVPQRAVQHPSLRGRARGPAGVCTTTSNSLTGQLATVRPSLSDALWMSMHLTQVARYARVTSHLAERPHPLAGTLQTRRSWRSREFMDCGRSRRALFEYMRDRAEARLCMRHS